MGRVYVTFFAYTLRFFNCTRRKTHKIIITHTEKGTFQGYKCTYLACYVIHCKDLKSVGQYHSFDLYPRNESGIVSDFFRNIFF